MGEIQKLKDKLAESVARGRENELSHTTMKSTVEALRLPFTRDIPVKAGSSNLNPNRAEEVKQVPGMVTVPSDDGFHTARCGDTLDAFGPL